VVKCSVCGSETERLESFTDLSLSFPPKDDGGSLTLEQMIKFTFRTETMSGDNQFRCSKCDKLVDATLAGWCEKRSLFSF
jgi:ubiquitin C-terminal hydrolase